MFASISSMFLRSFLQAVRRQQISANVLHNAAPCASRDIAPSQHPHACAKLPWLLKGDRSYTGQVSIPSLLSRRLESSRMPVSGHRVPLSSFSRGFAARGLKPEFVGGKLKPYSSYRERFRVEKGGRIRCQRPGHRHKRFVKGPKRNRQLRQRMTLHDAYAKTMKKLGFC